VLPHQRNEVRVGHVVSARLVAARLTEQLPESVRLAWCTHVRPLQKELAGYADYSTKVRYRLLPGVW